jgi:hypothetical protein
MTNPFNFIVENFDIVLEGLEDPERARSFLKVCLEVGYKISIFDSNNKKESIETAPDASVVELAKKLATHFRRTYVLQ